MIEYHFDVKQKNICFNFSLCFVVHGSLLYVPHLSGKNYAVRFRQTAHREPLWVDYTRGVPHVKNGVVYIPCRALKLHYHTTQHFSVK